jgi:hypothetical protein
MTGKIKTPTASPTPPKEGLQKQDLINNNKIICGIKNNNNRTMKQYNYFIIHNS